MCYKIDIFCILQLLYIEEKMVVECVIVEVVGVEKDSGGSR